MAEWRWELTSRLRWRVGEWGMPLVLEQCWIGCSMEGPYEVREEWRPVPMVDDKAALDAYR